LSHAEGWPPGTIAKELSVHHEVVERVLDAEHGAPKEHPPRASGLDPYKLVAQDGALVERVVSGQVPAKSLNQHRCPIESLADDPPSVQRGG
jgi:hypothetical protein